MTDLSTRRVLGVVLGSNFNDPTNERLILLSAAGLAVVGVALLVGTILWWRRGRQEHPALAPLEVLGSRGWVKSPEGERHRRLEKVRVSGGRGPGTNEPERSEPLDLQAMAQSDPRAFDDLREPGAAADDELVEDVVEPSPAGEPVEVGEVVAEPAAPASPPGAVAPVEINDPDATSVTAERPSALQGGNS